MYSLSLARLYHTCLSRMSNHSPAKVSFGHTREGVVLYLRAADTRWYFSMGLLCHNLTRTHFGRWDL